MRRYAALLRGIAPSNPNMTNDKLRGVFEGLGLEGVRSVLASGNIVFRSTQSDIPALEDAIQRALQLSSGTGEGNTPPIGPRRIVGGVVAGFTIAGLTAAIAVTLRRRRPEATP